MADQPQLDRGRAFLEASRCICATHRSRSRSQRFPDSRALSRVTNSAVSAPCSSFRCCAKAIASGSIVCRALSPSLQRQADRTAADLRRPGGDRHRECAAVRRGAGEDARPHGVAAAADRDLGRSGGHQLARPAIWSRCSRRCSRMPTRVCGANFGDDASMERRNFSTARDITNVPPSFDGASGGNPITSHPQSGLGRSRCSRSGSVQIPDVRADGLPRRGSRRGRSGRYRRRAHRRRWCRCCKEDELVGAIMIYRQEVRPFTDKQIALVRTSPSRP